MTILGMATIAELRDLLKAKDYTIDQLTEAWTGFLPTWAQRDLTGMQDYQHDFDALVSRYQKARARAQAAIDDAAYHRAHPGFGERVPADSLINAQSEWDGVLDALNPDWRNNGRPKGSLQDLNDRLQKAQGKAVDYRDMPQPAINSDADLNLFKKADLLLRNTGVLPPSPGQFPWARVLIGGAAGLIGGAALLPAAMIKAGTIGATLGWLSTKPWKKYLKP